MDTMAKVSTIRKGDVISGPCGYVNVLGVRKNASGRAVFDTDGAPFPAFSRNPQHNVWKRTVDAAPEAPQEAPAAQTELTEPLAPVSDEGGAEARFLAAVADKAAEAATEAPKAPRRRNRGKAATAPASASEEAKA